MVNHGVSHLLYWGNNRVICCRDCGRSF